MPDRQRLTQTLIDLIKIDSPSGEEDAIDREVSARLSSLGLTVEHDSYNNIIARLEGVGQPLLLSAHLDTVEPGRGIKPMLDADGETLRSDGSTILGGDCKAGIAIVLEGLTSAMEDGSLLRPVQVVFSRAEEGGLNGARNLDFSLVTATSGMVFDGEWEDGDIYNPRNGETYDAELEEVDANTLKVSGCVWFLCETQTWTRVE